MSTSPVSRVTNFRGRSDTSAVDTAATFIAAENAAFGVTVGTAFRIRIGVENTGTAADTITAPDTTRGIARCGVGPALAFSSLANVINGADAGASADATNIAVQQLTAGTGSFETGLAGYDENETLSTTSTNGKFTEVEFGVVLTGGAATIGVGGGESWTFQVGGLTNASANVPTFTTPDTNGTNFQHGNQLGGAGQQSANAASISMTTAAAVRAGNLVVVTVVCDNNGTTDGDFSEITGVTYDGIAMTKAKEFTNGQGAAQAGVTTSIWWYQDAAGRALGKTITATFATNTTNGDANAIQAREFVVGSGLTVSVENTNSAATDAATQPASLDCTTSNIECLRVACHGMEFGTQANADQANNVRASNSTWSLWWTSGSLLRTSAASTGNAANVGNLTEAKISTGTGAASRCGAMLTTGDWASCYVAFKAAVATKDIAPPRYTDADTFYAPSIGRGTRDLTTGLYSDPDTLYAPTVVSIWAVTAALYSDPDTIYASVIGKGARDLSPTLYSDPETYYAPTVAPGARGVTASLYSDPDTLYAPTVSGQAAVQGLTAGLYADPESFYAATIGRGSRTVSGTLYTDSDTFYAPLVGRGAVGVSAVTFADPDQFPAPSIGRGSRSLDAGLVSDPDQVFTPTAGCYNPLQVGLFLDPDMFFGAEVVVPGGLQSLVVPLYSDPDAFYAPGAVAGPVGLTGAFYEDPDELYAPEVAQVVAGEQALVGDLVINSNIFYPPTAASVVTAEERVPGARIAGGTFTRRRWRELQEAWEAQRALEMQAASLKAKTRKKLTLDRAAKAAERALYVAQAYEDIRVQALTRALEAAAGAQRAADAIGYANQAIRISRQMVDEEDDEEAAIMLILSGGG